MIEVLLSRGSITREMAAAAETFRGAFRVAHLDGLRAADLARIPGTRGPEPDRPVWARRNVESAISALGGLARVTGSIVWHCVGLEWSTKRWGREFGRDSRVACGVLIAALALLDAHYAGRRTAA